MLRKIQMKIICNYSKCVRRGGRKVQGGNAGGKRKRLPVMSSVSCFFISHAPWPTLPGLFSDSQILDCQWSKKGSQSTRFHPRIIEGVCF